MKKLFRFFFLPYGEKKLIGQALFFVIFFRLALWLLSYGRTKHWMENDGNFDSNTQKIDWNFVENIARSVRLCSRFVPFATCLTQALATKTLLRKYGQKSLLKIGVAKNESERFEAHAWIEIDGQIIIGKVPRHRRFAVLDSPDSVAL
jgi:hypothetical protein